MLPDGFLLKTMMLKKYRICNNLTESRRAAAWLALWSDLCKRLSVISDFYLLFISVTLEAQLSSGLGISRVCLVPTTECFDPLTAPSRGAPDACGCPSAPGHPCTPGLPPTPRWGSCSAGRGPCQTSLLTHSPLQVSEPTRPQFLFTGS